MVGLSFDLFEDLDSQIWKNNTFQDVPIYFLICFEVLWYNKNHKYGAPGHDKSRNHGIWRF